MIQIVAQRIRTLLVTGTIAAMVLAATVFVLPASTFAATSLDKILTGTEFQNTTKNTGLETKQLDPIVLSVRLLNYALTFLALLVVALILYAGYLYLTAQGAKDKVEKAQKILTYGLIGRLVKCTNQQNRYMIKTLAI